MTFAIYNARLVVNEQVLLVPASQPDVWAATPMPVFARLYTAGTASPAAEVESSIPSSSTIRTSC